MYKLIIIVTVLLVSCRCKNQPACKTDTDSARAIFRECVASGNQRSVHQCRIAAKELSLDCSEQTGKESGQESDGGF